MPSYRIRAAAVLLLASLASAVAAPENRVGIRTMTALAPVRGQSIELTVWYPTFSKEAPETFGGNKIFRGTPVLLNAPVADGSHPVILMAHGGLRAAPHEGWIAAHLATRGYIVGVARAPSLGPRDVRAAIQEIRLRPADLSAALTALENDPALSSRLKSEKTGVVGFFLGGTSALALVGARIDSNSYKHSCDRPEGGMDCAWFARNGVDLTKVDVSSLTGSHFDPRIEVAVAVDPELSKSFAPESLADIKTPVSIINLGEAGKTPLALEASGLEGITPGSRYERVVDATAFSAFSLCTPSGPALLREEGDDEDAICRDGSRSREEIHREIAEKIETALRRGLSASP